MRYDVIVIGGGIVGAGILRDCALRGLKTLLVEKGEPGEATTAASTHLIHGGLRYLLYDRLTTLVTSWDSGNIVRIARPMLTRLPILWPVYRSHAHGATTVETLLESYDDVAPLKAGLRHLRLPPAEVLRLAPGLEPRGLVGAFSFDEWWVDSVALVRENLRAAGAAGGAGAAEPGGRASPPRLGGCGSGGGAVEIRARTAVVGLLREGARVVGVRASGPSGTEALRASVVVNAAGPWVDRVASWADVRIPLRLRQGSHLVYDRALIGPGLPPPGDRRAPAGAAATPMRPFGLLLEAVDRERYVFVLASPGGTYVGPTDLPFSEDPDRLRTRPDEIRYLLESVRRYFKDFPERFDRTLVGARPILGQSGSERVLSREFEILVHGARDGVPGFITAAGGKMSDFRLMAQETVDAACRELGLRRACATHLTTLEGRRLAGATPLAPPARPLSRFLRRHPRLRQWHATAHLGAALARHLARRAAGSLRESSREDFLTHYYGGGVRP